MDLMTRGMLSLKWGLSAALCLPTEHAATPKSRLTAKPYMGPLRHFYNRFIYSKLRPAKFLGVCRDSQPNRFSPLEEGYIL